MSVEGWAGLQGVKEQPCVSVVVGSPLCLPGGPSTSRALPPCPPSVVARGPFLHGSTPTRLLATTLPGVTSDAPPEPAACCEGVTPLPPTSGRGVVLGERGCRLVPPGEKEDLGPLAMVRWVGDVGIARWLKVVFHGSQLAFPGFRGPSLGWRASGGETACAPCKDNSSPGLIFSFPRGLSAPAPTPPPSLPPRCPLPGGGRLISSVSLIPLASGLWREEGCLGWCPPASSKAFHLTKSGSPE